MDICLCQMEFFFFFLSFGKTKVSQQKNAGGRVFWQGVQRFFFRCWLGFSPTKTSEVLLADAVFGHSHFCDASEAWIFHWKFCWFFRRPAGLVEDLTTFLVAKLFFCYHNTGGRFEVSLMVVGCV